MVNIWHGIGLVNVTKLMMVWSCIVGHSYVLWFINKQLHVICM